MQIRILGISLIKNQKLLRKNCISIGNPDATLCSLFDKIISFLYLSKTYEKNCNYRGR